MKIKKGLDTKEEILKALQKKDKMRAVELAEKIDRPYPTIARNLRHLKKLGIIEYERQEVKTYWRKV